MAFMGWSLRRLLLGPRQSNLSLVSIEHCQSAVLEVHTHSDFLVRILNKRQLSQLYFLTGLWLIVTIAFAVWWSQPAHYTEPFRFAFNSFILAWSLTFPATTFTFYAR